MYSNSSDNLDESETSPVGPLFFSFPAQIRAVWGLSEHDEARGQVDAGD